MKASDARPGLLDINILIALIDSAHQFHAAAHAWFEAHCAAGWATCPLTENGCLRVMSNPGYPFPGLTVDRMRRILAELVLVKGHRFLPDSVSVLDAARYSLAGIGPRQLTDVYLLGLAVSNGGRLVTFDRSIPVHAVAGFRPVHLEVIPA